MLYFNDGEIEDHTNMQKIVYHYTSPLGIYSILQDDKLWFSDCQFLNDKSEYLYIKKPLIKALNLKGEKPDESFIDQLLFSEPYQSSSIELEKEGRKVHKIIIKCNRFFIFCASTSPDTQNMWNYYVKNGQYLGYNLGINVDTLIDHFLTLPGVTVTHGKVLYDEHKQVNQIKTFLERLDAEIEPIKRRYEEAKKLGMDDQYSIEDQLADHYQEELSKYIDERRLFFKHKAFKSENEYRFVVKVPVDFEDSAFELKHRIGINGVIIPYRELQYVRKNRLLIR